MFLIYLQAVFQPYFIDDEEQLKKEAVGYYRAIQAASIEESGKLTLLRVFESWMAERFAHISKKELQIRLPVMAKLEDTVVYKELKEEGRLEGRLEGRKEGLETAIEKLRELVANGILSPEGFEKGSAPLKQETAMLSSGNEK